MVPPGRGTVAAMGTVRMAVEADAAGIARVQVLTWRVAYEGLIDADYLAKLSIEERTDRWQRSIANGRFPSLVLLGTDDDVIGFACQGPSREDAAPPTQGELLALYVLQAHWRSGLGRRLYQRSEAALLDAGFTEAILWVLDGNARAEQFYRAVGYELDGAAKDLTLAEGVILHHRRMHKRLA